MHEFKLNSKARSRHILSRSKYIPASPLFREGKLLLGKGITGDKETSLSDDNLHEITEELTAFDSTSELLSRKIENLSSLKNIRSSPLKSATITDAQATLASEITGN